MTTCLDAHPLCSFISSHLLHLEHDSHPQPCRYSCLGLGDVSDMPDLLCIQRRGDVGGGQELDNGSECVRHALASLRRVINSDEGTKPGDHDKVHARLECPVQDTTTPTPGNKTYVPHAQLRWPRPATAATIYCLPPRPSHRGCRAQLNRSYPAASY